MTCATSRALHGSAIMEAHVRAMGGPPTTCEEALLDVAWTWPDTAEGDRWRRAIMIAAEEMRREDIAARGRIA